MMKPSKPKITRRTFLAASTFGMGALLFADRSLRSITDQLSKLGVSVPWYRQGQVKTT
jgi:hypothetical protein